MSPFIVLALVFTLALFAVVVLVAVVVGIHSERHSREMDHQGTGNVRRDGSPAARRLRRQADRHDHPRRPRRVPYRTVNRLVEQGRW